MQRRIHGAWGGGALLFGLSGCKLAVLDPQGPVAAQESQILIDAVAIMLAIVVPTLLAIIAFAWWFRAGNARARYRPDYQYSGRVELVVWSIPALTVLLLSGVIWIGSHRLDPYRPVEGEGDPVEVQVVSLDWKWLFLYPRQNIASVNLLVVPVGAPLRLSLTSGSVMTAFFVPQWGSLIYTMNGMRTQLNLRVDHPGPYYGQAAQVAGDGFSDMHFEARAVSPDEFADWAKKVASGQPAFDEAAYVELQTPGLAGVTVRPLVDPHLFEDIVAQKLPPAPGPSATPRPSPMRETRAR